MRQQFQGFIGATYRGQSPFVDCEQCLNLYPEITGEPGAHAVAQIVLYPTPGLVAFATGGDGAVRALFAENGRCFAVIGSIFGEVKSDGTFTSYGTVLTNALGATIVSNGPAGHQLLVISGGRGYIFDLVANTFALIADGDFPANAQTAAFSDGYFLVLPYNDTKFFFSALFDGTSWDALDVVQKSQTSDAIRSLVVSHKEVWLFGSKTTEVWYNTGDALVTFAPIQGVLIEHGISPVQSAARVNNTLCWFGEDADGHGQAWYADGYTPMRFSTHAIEQQWASYATIDDTIAWTYQERGHSFFVLTFPTAQATWVFDFATKMWHERGFDNEGTIEAHLARNHAFAFEKHLVGSRVNGTIYEQNADFLDDAGSAIRRVRRSPHVTISRNRFSVYEFVLEMQSGTGTDTGQGANPQVMFRYSTDGGRTWSNELFGGSGPIGDYTKVTRWSRMGDGRDWAFEIAVTDPVPYAFTNAFLDIEAALS